MDIFKQKLKNGTHKVRFTECENPRDSILTHKWSKDKTIGEEVIVQGNKGIRRFRDWLNKLDI